jgi:hypothetical protein
MEIYCELLLKTAAQAFQMKVSIVFSTVSTLIAPAVKRVLGITPGLALALPGTLLNPTKVEFVLRTVETVMRRATLVVRKYWVPASL